jgi:penicillin-binding protein A
MTLTREISRLLAATLVAFGVVALAASYWAIVGPDTLLQRTDNPRLVLAEAAIQRGIIQDRVGRLLADTLIGTGGQVERYYPQPEVSSLVGYSSLRYGVGGAEAMFNTILRGDDLSPGLLSELIDSLLHRPQRGSDIRLTLDLTVQQMAVQAFKDQAGAAAVLAVPSGEVLGLVSLPTFNPNTLDAEWEQLITSAEEPFFNRALQGSYQPGGMLETPLMVAAMLTSESITDPIPGATNPIRIDDLELTCALRLPRLELPLRDAYAFGCPLPFAQVAERIGSQVLEETLARFHFNAPVTIEGFAARTEDQTLTNITIDDATLVESALGQGHLTVTPLQMAVMAAAIVNDGNAPRPYTLIATRAPDAEMWQPAATTRSTIPFTTEGTARQLQDLMRNAVANGAALNAARPEIDIGGHAALAYSGDETQSWFIGFATLPGRRGIAVAVVLENSDDPGLAADIGGTLLEAAHQTLRALPQQSS